jgi:hypothetical protein
MTALSSHKASAIEALLAENLVEVASELRLVNVIDLICYVQDERAAVLDDLVNSAAELTFRRGALRYAWSGGIDVFWEAPPSVSLDMEFRWLGATAFFRLRLDRDCAGVTLQHLSLDEGGGGADAFEGLARALAAARRPPVSTKDANGGLFFRP